MQKDQRYSRIDQLGDEDDVTKNSASISEGAYRDDPSTSEGSLQNPGRLQRSHSTPMSVPNSLPSQNQSPDHPLQQQQQQCNSEMKDGSNGGYNNLRMRRARSPPGTRHGSKPKQSLSREGSQENIVVLEGLGHIDIVHASHGSVTSPPRSSRLTHSKKKSSDGTSSSVAEDGAENDAAERGGGEIREDDGDDLFCVSHGSSFDILDDEDEINLQRYHRDFGAAPYQDDLGGWDDDGMDLNIHSTYHPRSESNGGSHSKDPWIRMITQNNQHSPTNGTMPFSAIHSISDLLLYLQGVRRQARQRRAQRLLTMPSEQWWERLQFCFMTYCWDATDVGLLVVAILLVVWFTGLLWLARINARQATTANETHEYNGNAEFDEYEKHGRSWRLLFQWWWWGLGCVLLVRILGPFAVQNVNNRRRERRRQRFMSGTMDEQQRRMQQQQLPTIDASPSSGNCDVRSMNDPSSMPGVEITEASDSNDAGAFSPQDRMNIV